MRKLVSLLLLKPILWVIQNFTSAPDRERVFEALTTLKTKIENGSAKKGFVIPFEPGTHRFIIFSDQHKGRKNGADDFMAAEANYLAALNYYHSEKFHLICLGDAEELWENTLLQVRKHNQASFDAEKKFALRNTFTKIFGNHDLDWQVDPLAPAYLKEIFDVEVPALEGIMLETKLQEKVLRIYCTHGHQGDLQADGNWFSKFFVSKIWAPLQAYVRINPNTPSTNQSLKTLHNAMMYEWSAMQRNLILITGHTHQPVFESLTHLERLHRKKQQALYDANPEWAKSIQNEIQWRSAESEPISANYLKMKPAYFNTGCCCYVDGDISGIEIADGFIRLIKWESKGKAPRRIVLEETPLGELVKKLGDN